MFKINALFFQLCLSFVTLLCNAQAVTKKIVVEHFTNTRCSVCASRNPNFYAAKNTKPDVLHIAYHPSSPYSTCLFSTQNKSENDARTRYYDVFGSTPQFLINGVLRSSSAVGNANVYQTFENKTSPFEVNVMLFPNGNDSIKVEVDVKAVATHNYSSLMLYIPLIEDTVFYNAPNGEKEHYDVFRKSFTGINSLTFNAPVLGGSNFVYTANIAVNSEWNQRRLAAIAIISSTVNEVIQAAQSPLFGVVSSAEEITTHHDDPVVIYPNPTTDEIRLEVLESFIGSKYSIVNFSGQLVLSETIQTKTTYIKLQHLPSSTYVLHVGSGSDSKSISKTFMKY